MVVEDAEVVPRTLEVVMPTGKLRATLYTKDEGKGAPWISVQSVSNDDLDVIINTSHPFVAACCEDERGTVIIAKRSEEHTSELQSLMRSSYAVFCLKTKQPKHRQ